jgi:hypothetical protein
MNKFKTLQELLTEAVDKKIELIISKDLWEYINKITIPYREWDVNHKNEFQNIKAKYAKKNIIQKRINPNFSWELDDSLSIMNNTWYKFRNDIIKPIFSNENVTSVSEDPTEKRNRITTVEEREKIKSAVLKYIKSKKDGVRFTDINKFVVLNVLKEEYFDAGKIAWHSTVAQNCIRKLLLIDKVIKKDENTGLYIYVSNK